VVKNVLTMASGETDDRLPFRADAGVSYEFFPGAAVNVTLMDFSDIAAGLEWEVGDRLALRMGDAGGGDFGAGVGIRWNRARFDVAFTPERANGIGSTLASSLTYQFGADWEAYRGKSSVKAEERARELAREGQWLAALRQLNRANSLDPGNETAEALRMRLKGALGAARVTRSKQERALRSQPEWGLVKEGMEEYLMGTPHRAQILVGYAAMKRPEEFRYQSLLGHFEAESGVSVFRAEDKSLRPSAYLELKRKRVQEAFEGKNYGEALREAEELVMLEPESVEDLARLGSLYFAIDKKAEAEAIFERVLKLDPQNKTVKEFMRQKGLNGKPKTEVAP
jgi:tetratricopeptide (TPR) repeat protein